MNFVLKEISSPKMALVVNETQSQQLFFTFSIFYSILKLKNMNTVGFWWKIMKIPELFECFSP